MKYIKIDPYVFYKDFLEIIEMGEDGWYTLQHDVLLDLHYAPDPVKISKNETRYGASGNCWYLDDAGSLLIMKGFRWNGSNVVADQPCKMMASCVHDVLCAKESKGTYSYWRKNKIYYDISKSQGAGWFLSGKEFLGLLIGNWF